MLLAAGKLLPAFSFTMFCSLELQIPVTLMNFKFRKNKPENNNGCGGFRMERG